MRFLINTRSYTLQRNCDLLVRMTLGEERCLHLCTHPMDNLQVMYRITEVSSFAKNKKHYDIVFISNVLSKLVLWDRLNLLVYTFSCACLTGERFSFSLICCSLMCVKKRTEVCVTLSHCEKFSCWRDIYFLLLTVWPRPFRLCLMITCTDSLCLY